MAKFLCCTARSWALAVRLMNINFILCLIQCLILFPFSRQCKCLVNDQPLISRLQDLLGLFLKFGIECMQSINAGVLNDAKETIEKITELEKVFQALSKIFQGHYSLYQAHRRVHGKVQVTNLIILVVICKLFFTRCALKFIFE